MLTIYISFTVQFNFADIAVKMYGKTGAGHDTDTVETVPTSSIKFGPPVFTVLESRQVKPERKYLFSFD